MNVFYPEVVHDEDKMDGLRLVFEEAWGYSGWDVATEGEMDE